MLTLMIYCDSQGIFSSRKIERASYTHVPTCDLLADHHPNHSTIAAVRKQKEQAFDQAVVQVLQVAVEAGRLKPGRVAI